jgi:WD40 repeat protein
MVGVVQNTDRMKQELDLAKLEGATEAGFESFSDRNEAQCLQGTRTELLQQILEWALSPSGKTIFWLRGMAGTGKSTIARTIAQSLKDNNLLGASFFFKRGERDRGNAKKFFPTLIKQLMLEFPELRPSVQKALDDDPDIASKSLGEQFDKLLLRPLLYLSQPDQQTRSTVIVIDALDECELDQDIRNIIGFLSLLRKAKSIRLRIFLTSRPELPISLGFSEIADHEYQDLALHEIPEEATERDIQLFLQNRFTKIKKDRNIPDGWPSTEAIQALVAMSAPLFISAATVCRYIENSRWEPKLRLAELLKDQAKYVSRMDKTYLPILTRLLDDPESDKSEHEQLIQEFQRIVGVIILLAVPLSINALSLFLGIEADQISNRLDSLRSVLSVPGDRDQPVRILHLSFRDWLVQSETKFLVDERKKHRDIASSCLKTMRSNLRKNICSLASPGTPRADIDPQELRKCLTPELQYSCRYWIDHLEHSQALSSEIEDVRLFLQKHFLHWVEAMSLLGLMSEVVVMLDLLYRIIPVRTIGASHGDGHFAILAFIRDAKRFILKNRQKAEEVPLQLYCAGLIFAPQTSIIRRELRTELPTWICQLPLVEDRWSAELQALEGHSDSVRSVTFSFNGRLLASSSRDKTVRLWDPAEGTLLQTLEGHFRSVRSVAFSHDSQLLASGANDKTVRLWDPATGALLQTLEGHSDSVRAVAFSCDGRLLASGSADKGIRVWDSATGALLQTLEGHSGGVHSIAFSQDGRLLASGSNDKTVRLWDPATGALLQTLEGHSDWVRSVAFSHDSHLLASGADDTIVRLWDPATGAQQQTLQGHSDYVRSVAFSRDGQLLASSSRDKTVRLWDPAKGTLLQTLKGHFGSVRSVAFSHDSQLLASGANDKTVRLWDPAIDGPQQKPEGHSDWVWVVAFSPNGRLLASGSDDNTVRLWDPATGGLKQTLTGHSGAVWAVAFSRNGRLLASGSSDNTVRLWDPVTGALQRTLNTSGAINHLEFAQDNSHLITNLGSLDIQFKSENHASRLTLGNLEISIDQGQWIKLNGRHALWLPPEYRPSCSAIHGNLIALGHASGRVSFLRFHL